MSNLLIVRRGRWMPAQPCDLRRHDLIDIRDPYTLAFTASEAPEAVHARELVPLARGVRA